MRKILIFILLQIYAFSYAEDIRFTAQAPSTVAVGSQFKVTYTINARPSNFKNPSFNDFELLFGPSTSSSSSISIVNGSISQEISYTYTFVLLANKEGKFTISPAEVTVNGKVFKSNSLSIEVIKGNASTNFQSQTNNRNTNNNQKTLVSSDDVFLRVSVNKNTVYQGEQLVASVYIYTRLNIVGFEDIKFPNMSGFWSEDLENPNQISLKQEYVNGQLYNVGLLKRVVLTPQRSGTLTIDPVVAKVIVQQRVQKRRRSIFDDFFDDFFSTYRNVSKNLASPKIKINVKPLPENKPQSFSGGVGAFKLESHVDNTNLKINEAFNYSLKLSGSGNIKLVDIPKPNFPTDFEVYDPKITNNYKTKDGVSSGSKTVSYIIIPRHSGNYTIPAFDFSYFDLKTKSYKTIHIDDVNINVAKDSAITANTIISEFSKKDVSVLGSDIRYVKEDVEPLSKANYLLFSSVFYVLAYPLSVILLLILLFVRREQIKQRNNVMAMRNKKANKVATKRLKEAQKFLKNNDKQRFYEEVTKALWGYLSDKLMIPMADFTKELAFQKLNEKNIDSSIIAELNEVIDNCELARYSPTAVNMSMNDIYNKAAKSIRMLESLI